MNNNDSFDLKTSDNQKCLVRIGDSGFSPAVGEIVEVIGVVQEDMSIGQFNGMTFPETFDMDVYDQFVTLSQNYPHLFATSEY
uniref:Uncharacterized protein n=1 Tax=Arcella intermedia TaxID=1963864 RepID=A0A6B2LTD7_9EUKA